MENLNFGKYYDDAVLNEVKSLFKSSIRLKKRLGLGKIDYLRVVKAPDRESKRYIVMLKSGRDIELDEEYIF